MRSWIAASIVFLAVAAGSDLPAAEIAGVRFESALAAADSTLSLNGVGLRTKTFLRIKVYAAGLYLPRTCTDGEVVAAADDPRPCGWSSSMTVSLRRNWWNPGTRGSRRAPTASWAR